MKRSVVTRTVNFADCDPARLVFYPRYFDWFDRGSEILFRSVGFDWATEFNSATLLGVPLVDAQAKFKRPCRFGDVIEIASWIGEWRDKTFVVDHQVINRGEVAVEGREIRVWAVADHSRPNGLRAMPVPDHVRALFES